MTYRENDNDDFDGFDEFDGLEDLGGPIDWDEVRHTFVWSSVIFGLGISLTTTTGGMAVSNVLSGIMSEIGFMAAVWPWA